MQYLAECQDMLEQLKLDHPIPATVRFKTDFQSGTYLTGRCKYLLGQASQMNPVTGLQLATVRVALGNPLAKCLDTVAHEYWHVVQVQVLGLWAKRPRFESSFETDARKFAAAYTKEYMTKRCLT